jgi:hypothetical protein
MKRGRKDFAIARQRAIDSLLVQALQQKVAAQVPKATTEEAQRFVQANPDMFAERKVFILDQLQMPRPSDPALVKALEPMKTFDQIQALLTQQKIPFKRVQTGLDAVGADPRLIQAILKLPPDELFLLPSGQALTVNQIKETKVIPFTGDKAVAYAQQVVTRQRTQEALQRRIQELLAARRNDVRYSKDFAPPPKPPASSPTPAKPGTAPSPAAAAQSGGG